MAIKKAERGVLTARNLFREGTFMSGLLPALVSIALCMGLAVSCIYDDYDDGTDEVAETSLGFNIRLASTGTSTGYEVGSDYENYVDISGGDYRIYFFTNDQEEGHGDEDTFIARFDPTSMFATFGSSYTWYYMTGDVPSELLSLRDDGGSSSFKIVILANWGTDNYPTPSSGTTIRDICTPDATDASGTFSYKTDFDLNESNLIPFYGVQEYEDIVFVKNEIKDLGTPICLLRAMAKVEVLLTNSDLQFDSVKICRYNEKGCCAPLGLYDGSYVISYTDYPWDYDDGIHLVDADGNNDADQSDPLESDNIRKLSFLNTLAHENADPDSGIYETWCCYVPEYRNTVTTDGVTTTADDYAYIQLGFLGYKDEELENYRIYFSDYTDGTTSSHGDYDIGRNVIYRFIVTIKEGVFTVLPMDWEYTFDNNFDVYD